MVNWFIFQPHGSTGGHHHLDNYSHRSCLGQNQSVGHLVGGDFCVFRRHPCRTHRPVNRPDHTPLHRKSRPGTVCLRTWTQSRPRLLQLFPQRWPRAQHARPRRDDYRHSHGHTLHTPARRAHRRRHRSAVRSHHQHPGSRSRPAGTRTGGIVGQRCRAELCGHLSARRGGSNTCHNPHAQNVHSPGHTAVITSRRLRHNFYCRVSSMQSGHLWHDRTSDFSSGRY